jgi:DNA primase
LRDLQRTGRVGRIDVQIASRKGETRGDIYIASSLDRAETAILAASLETIDRVGPCVARVRVESIEDIRVSKRRHIVDRAKQLLVDSFEEGTINSNVLIDEVRETMRMEKIITIGEDKVPAGPNVPDSDAIIVVEGRADVLNLLRYGIKNAVGVEGTSISRTIIDLCEKKTTTAFLDGDRGGDLILRELLQLAEIDYVAYAPRGKSVEDLSRKEITKSLRNKIPVEYVKEELAMEAAEEAAPDKKGGKPSEPGETPRPADTAARQPRRRGQQRAQPAPRGPMTLADHLEAVRGKKIARFLSPDFQVVGEASAEEVEKALKALNGEAAGLVLDGDVNQRLLDTLVGMGFEYVAARNYQGLIKRPLSIRLLKIT